MYQIVGMRPYSFTPDGQTNAISGYTVWALEDAQAGQGVGRLPVKLGMNSETYAKLIETNGGIESLIGKRVDLSFNRFGKVVGLSVVK